MKLPDSPVAFAVVIAAGALLLLVSRVVGLWLRSIFAGSPVSLASIVRLNLTMLRAGDIVDAYLVCRKAGVTIGLEELEALYLAAPERFRDDVKQLMAEKLAARK